MFSCEHSSGNTRGAPVQESLWKTFRISYQSHSVTGQLIYSLPTGILPPVSLFSRLSTRHRTKTLYSREKFTFLPLSLSVSHFEALFQAISFDHGRRGSATMPFSTCPSYISSRRRTLRGTGGNSYFRIILRDTCDKCISSRRAGCSRATRPIVLSLSPSLSSSVLQTERYVTAAYLPPPITRKHHNTSVLSVHPLPAS